MAQTPPKDSQVLRGPIMNTFLASFPDMQIEFWHNVSQNKTFHMLRGFLNLLSTPPISLFYTSEIYQEYHDDHMFLIAFLMFDNNFYLTKLSYNN